MGDGARVFFDSIYTGWHGRQRWLRAATGFVVVLAYLYFMSARLMCPVEGYEWPGALR